MKNLHLSLKKQWFEMTKSGEKTEDYREINKYWVTRLTQCEIDPDVAAKELLSGASYFKSEWDLTARLPMHCYPKYFRSNVMTLGYPKSNDTSRIKVFEHKGIEIRTGKPEWGAEAGKLYFVILHGIEIIR